MSAAPMRRFPVALLVKLICVVNLMIASVIFSSFAGWYDTGNWSTADAMPVALTAVVLASIALRLAPSARPWRTSTLFWLAASIFVVVMSFAIGVYLRFGLGAVALVAIFYWVMGAPFGLMSGLINSAVLRLAEPRS
jgi:hypothetical protein